MKHLLERLKKHDEESCLLRVEEWKHDEQKGEKGRRDLKRELCKFFATVVILKQTDTLWY